MSNADTLGNALDQNDSSDQKKLCTNRLLNLTKDECIELLQGHDAGINHEDKVAFNELCMERVNNVQSVLPWKDLKLDSKVHPNW